MVATLRCHVREDGFAFTCDDSGSLVDFDDWPKKTDLGAGAKQPSLGALLRIAEGERSVLESSKILLVKHSDIAELADNEIANLDLPKPMPYSISIQSRGNIIDREFQFQYTFRHSDQRPVIGWHRIGSHLQVGKRCYLVTAPLFQLLELLDRFNDALPSQLDQRLSVLAELKDLDLPATIGLDNYLSGINVVRPSMFTVRPFINELNAPDFEIDLLRPTTGHENSLPDDEAESISQALPEAASKMFNRQFRERPSVRGSYSLSGGWYAVLPRSLAKGLEVAHRALKSGSDKRRAFISNPRVFIREELDEEFGEDFGERLFCETAEYSERVRDIGIWEAPILPFSPSSGVAWLPAESCEVRVGGVSLSLKRNQISELILQLARALQTGVAKLEYEGQVIPVQADVLEELQALSSKVCGHEFNTEGLSPDVQETESKEGADRSIALLIERNLESTPTEIGERERSARLPEVIDGIRNELLPHQRTAYEWMREHWESGSRGALLADDMGLGKTFEALVFMASIRRLIQSGLIPRCPILVVAPTGLLRNWEDEHSIHLVAPGLGEKCRAYGVGLKEIRVARAHQGRSSELQTGLPVLDTKRLRKADWVLTSYETLRDYHHSFGRVRWALIVFDEVQKIKNPRTLLTEAAKAMNTDFALALTGTPVENRLADIWCIVDTVNPGRLGALKEFVNNYELDTNADLPRLRTELMGKKPPNIMLRRMKEDQLRGLPKKSENVFEVQMPTSQANAYSEAVQEGQSVNGRSDMLRILQRLRSISLHPRSRGEESDENYIACSARLRTALDLLDQISKKREKALIFIESLQMQGELSDILTRRYNLGKPPLIINGSVSGERRKDRADAFQESEGFDVMLLSPRAGGVGLTLTAANHVIHLSRWWNPAVEDQCTDRVFRIGQKRTVHVYFPLAVHPTIGACSFDLRLNSLLSKKRTLSRNLLAPPTMTADDINQLFSDTIQGK